MRQIKYRYIETITDLQKCQINVLGNKKLKLTRFNSNILKNIHIYRYLNSYTYI